LVRRHPRDKGFGFVERCPEALHDGVRAQRLARHQQRFPPDFMFQLTGKEAGRLGITECDTFPPQFGRLPAVRAFTQEGVAMLSSVLNSERAVLVNTSPSCAPS